MLPMEILNFKLGKFDGIIAYGFGQVDNKINEGDFGCREKRGGGTNNTLQEAKGNKMILPDSMF